MQVNEVRFSQLANFQPKQELAFNTLLSEKCKYILYGGAGCFTPDTLVLTERGYIEINKVCVGTRVYSFKNNKIILSKVTNTFVYGGDKKQNMIELVVDGEKITTTPNHRFYINGHWVPASTIYERVLEICGGDEQQLLNLKSRAFTNEELERFWQGRDNETSFRRRWIPEDNDKVRQDKNCKNTQTCSSGLDTKPRKQKRSKPQKLQQIGQQSRKLGVGDWFRELHSRIKRWKDGQLHKIPGKEYSKTKAGFFEWTVNIDRKRCGTNKERVYSQSGDQENAWRKVWSSSSNYKRYYFEEKLEARELDIREIDSIKCVSVKTKVYDLEVEAVNYIVSKKNIIVHNSGGKSYWIRWSALALVLYYTQKYGLKGVEVGIFSEDYPTLKDRQIGKIKREFPEWLGKLRNSQETGYAFHLRDEYGGGMIKLRNLDDPSKYASAEFAAIFVEEITKNKKETFDDLRFRLRWPGIKDVKFGAATNPGSIGHAWCRKLWVKPDLNNPDNEQDRFFYIPATVYDNQYIDEDYIQQLESLPPKKRKMLLEGSWDTPEGQVFEEWRDDLHVLNSPVIPNKNLDHVLWIDWGYSEKSYFAALLSAIIPMTTKDGQKFNRIITYKEFYGNLTKPKDWAKIIYRFCEKNGIRPIIGVTDSNMHNPREDGGTSIAKMMEQEWKELFNGTWLRLVKGSKTGKNDRVNRVGMMHEWLSICPDGLPYWLFSPTCHNAIRTIPDLVYDENLVEAYDTSQEDHIADAAAYGLEKVKFIGIKSGKLNMGGTIQTTARVKRDNQGNELAFDLNKWGDDIEEERHKDSNEWKF